MKNIFNLSGKVAVVTGGSRGIGAMIAQGYLEFGAKVYICARKVEACLEAADHLSQYGECVGFGADLSSVDGIAAFAKEIEDREDKLDILVNNAGAAWAAPIDDFTEEAWDKVMDINLKSPFFTTQKFLPLLRKASTLKDPARIINIASVDGQHVPNPDTYPYSASKSAVIHMTRVLAKKLARDHVNVTAIAPGPFPSEMTKKYFASLGDQLVDAVPRARIGEPEDMAGVAIYLASRAGNYVTGETITVDGGWATTV